MLALIVMVLADAVFVAVESRAMPAHAVAAWRLECAAAHRLASS
jgi:hypothetical protein